MAARQALAGFDGDVLVGYGINDRQDLGAAQAVVQTLSGPDAPTYREKCGLERSPISLDRSRRR
jgi:hypothetical protein